MGYGIKILSPVSRNDVTRSPGWIDKRKIIFIPFVILIGLEGPPANEWGVTQKATASVAFTEIMLSLFKQT